MGLWLMPSPEGYRDGRVNVAQHDDLVPFMETYAYLMNSDILRGTMLLESPLLDYHVTQGGSFFEMPNGPSTVELDRLARERNLPYWSAEFRFWGPPKVIDAQWEYVKEKFGAIPGATFADGRRYVFPAEVDQNDPTLDRRARHAVARRVRPAARRRPSRLLADHSDDGRGSLQGADGVRPAIRRPALPAANQFAALPWSYNPRALVLLFGLPMSRDKAQNKQSREIFERLVEVSAANGWAEYRTHIAFMDKVADMYTFNDHAMRRFHETLKDAVDPNGILSPGKSGIWPSGLRRA